VVAPVVLAVLVAEHLNILLVLPRHTSQRRNSVMDLSTNARVSGGETQLGNLFSLKRHTRTYLVKDVGL
jgi:hypothetical protein